ncbi:MAG: hypothetical protein WBA46_17285 [Thermomicrobiales bacterium]
MVETMFRAMATRCEVSIIEGRGPAGWRPLGNASLRPCDLVPGSGDTDRDRGLGSRPVARLIGRARAPGWPEMVVSGIFIDTQRTRRVHDGAGNRVTGETEAGDGRRQWTMHLSLAHRGEDHSALAR